MKFDNRAAGATLVAAVALLLACDAKAATITLGDQDFTDGQTVAGVAGFNGPSAGEPAPFNSFKGSDQGASNVLSESWTFAYAPGGLSSASITIGIFDHDSQAAGSQIATFSVDGNDLTALLDAQFESYGGAQIEYNVYTVNLPAVTFTDLADGSATFTLTLAPPALGGLDNTGNGAGLDFATLVVIPEPSFAVLGAALVVSCVGFSRPTRTRRAGFSCTV